MPRFLFNGAFFLSFFYLACTKRYNMDMTSLNFDSEYWKQKPCPKYDCRKSSCKCGLERVFLSTALGDDSEESPVAPENGAYCNAVVVYEANGNVYLYSKEGIPTLVSSEGNVDELIDSLEKELRAEVSNRREADDALQTEIDNIKNSPDVVDIVPTYAALQNYDTSDLGDKDIVRVLADETHDGNSTYYRWNASTSSWIFVGIIGPTVVQTTGASTTDVMSQNAVTEALANVGGGVATLSNDDYNWPSNNPDGVALWLLIPGIYYKPAGIKVYTSIDRNENVRSNLFSVGWGDGDDKLIFSTRPESNVTGSYAVSGPRLFTTNSITGVANKYSSPTTCGTMLTVDNVVNNLSYNVSYDNARVLSAYQGWVLNDKITAINTRLGGLTLVSISQTDYDALTTKDPNTLYVITGA